MARFTATTHKEEFKADTMKTILRKASGICNCYCNPIDTLEVVDNSTFKTMLFIRSNKKAPNNTIERGQWK